MVKNVLSFPNIWQGRGIGISLLAVRLAAIYEQSSSPLNAELTYQIE
jgi:hypothetical protein